LVINRVTLIRAGALMLIVACGGLAEDGPHGLSNTAGAACSTGENCGNAERAGAERGRDASESPARNAADEADARASDDSHATGADSHAGEVAGSGTPEATSSRVGHPCDTGALGPEGRIAVGEILLVDNAGCGARNVCLMRSRQTDEDSCSSEPEFAPPGDCTGTVLNSEIVPVPPALSPAAPAVDGLCTCRCAGAEESAPYCACPTDMVCRELVVSSGVNGAARDYVGSYCLH
jgi:hypothetical protein